jgi:UDPglucose 6-dehydrogenase
MKVCVQGLWHLGSVTAACLASLGYSVSGLDADQDTVYGLSNGKAPISEPGLDDLIQRGIATGNLAFSSSAAQALADVDVLWVTFDTPVDSDDRADVDFVLWQIELVLSHLPFGATVLVSSQLPVGSTRRLEAVAVEKFADRNLGFAYSPENLRLGKALDVFLNPDRIVVGTRLERERLRLEKLLHPITDRIEWMSVESAEMTKHAINAFLATSVTFANEIASICELVGADAKQVERGLKTEQRIGPKAYLSPGGAFAGGTLARDVNFLEQTASTKGLKIPLLDSVKPSNDEHKNWARRRLTAKFPDLTGKTIAIWGLTYKPGTDTLRRSLAVELCNWLLDQGVNLRVHDPAVVELPLEWKGRVVQCKKPMEALQHSCALVVATEWPLYREFTVEDFSIAEPGLLVVDANRFLGAQLQVPGIAYAAVGTPQGELQ